MSNKEKERILNFISFTRNTDDVKENLNDFFDESFVEFLLEESRMTPGQLSIALSCFDYNVIFRNNQLTDRDKKLLLLLLTADINIGEIVKNFDNDVYLEFKEYIKQLTDLGYINALQIITTNDIGIIQEIINDLSLSYIDLYKILSSHSIELNIKNYLLSIPNIREMFINKTNVSVFYDIVGELNLDESFILSRCERLQNSLTNPNVSITDFREIVSELICRDSYHNFMLNLELISNYCASETNMPSRLVELANSLLPIQNILVKDTITQEEIDFLMTSYKELGLHLNEALSLIKDNFNRNLNSELQKGNKYLVHTEDIRNLIENDDIRGNYNKRIKHKTGRISFSLLDENKTGIYGGKKNSIIFGYNKTPNNNLLSATLGDARTAQSRIWTRSTFLSIDDYLKNSSPEHNELLYGGIDEVIEPDYILSMYEEATELEQRIASIFNIPIRYLKEKEIEEDFDRYPDKEYKYRDFEEIQYITNYIEINKTF